MKNIDQYVNTLSEEEKRNFHDLIQECRGREEEITKNGIKLSEDLQRLSEVTDNLLDQVEATKDASDELAVLYENTLDNIQKICLYMISDDRFYHA